MCYSLTGMLKPVVSTSLHNYALLSLSFWQRKKTIKPRSYKVLSFGCNYKKAKQASEYNEEISHSHTADQPKAT